jgi:hypothetical protein
MRFGTGREEGTKAKASLPLSSRLKLNCLAKAIMVNIAIFDINAVILMLSKDLSARIWQVLAVLADR